MSFAISLNLLRHGKYNGAMLSTKLKKRVVPVVQYAHGQVVKSINFNRFRTIGNLEMTVGLYNKRLIDELVLLDIGLANERGSIKSSVLRWLSENSMMPITYGGGIRRLKDIEVCLNNGCDRVIINQAAVHSPELLQRACECFGGQAIVAGVDYCSHPAGERQLYAYWEPNLEQRRLIDHYKTIVDMGVSEILLTDVTRDGSMSGMDIDLFENLGSFERVPTIINGGAGSPEDFTKAFNAGAVAVCASSIFLFSEFSYGDVKAYAGDFNPQWISKQKPII
jgi:imidazole glycerol-phosphate synthase subunit HisF